MLCNLHHALRHIVLSFFISGLDSMCQTLRRGMQCLSTMLLHQSIILWIITRIWKQPHRLIILVIEWKEFWCSSDLNLESNFRIHCNLPAQNGVSHVLMGLIKNPITPSTVGEFAVAWCFALAVQVLYDTRWIFILFSGPSILVFRSFWVRFAFSAWNKLAKVKLVPGVILSITVIKVSTTPGIVTIRIGSRAGTSAGFRFGRVDCISHRLRGTAFNLWSTYYSHSLPTIPGKLKFTKITPSSSLFPHKMDSGNPITTF